jgi:sugar phosphate isomerase/epimerase
MDDVEAPLPVDRQGMRSDPGTSTNTVPKKNEARDVLLATCWTSAGDVIPGGPDQRSPLSLRERIEAASAAGFRGFGLHTADLPKAVQQYGLQGIRSMLGDNGMSDVELEGVAEWWSRTPSVDELVGPILAAIEALGCGHLKLNPDHQDRPWDPSRWAARFAALAAKAESVGARLGLEFLPWSNVKDLDSALRFVEKVGHPGGGIVIDVWHLERSGTDPAHLLEVPLPRVTGVELNDAARDVRGSILEDTISRRLYCGEGVFRLQTFIGALRAIGWNGPWGIEILSTEHRRTPLSEGLAKAYATARSQLELGSSAKADVSARSAHNQR